MANTQIISVVDRLTDEQRQCDQRIRLEQAEARRQMDESLRICGSRLWINGERQPQLPMQVMEGLEEILGYPGVGRLIGFYLDGEECRYDDGRSSGTGEVDALLLFLRHWSIASRVQAYHFGSSEATARHWLVLDCERRQMTVVPVVTARRMVEAQWSLPEPEQVMVLDRVSWTAFVQELRDHLQNVQVNPLVWEMHHQNRILEMLSWLNEHA